MPPTILFVLNNFNDVDHMAPLVLRLLEKGTRIVVLCFSDYDLSSDPRIFHFQTFQGYRVIRLPMLVPLHKSSNLVKKLIRETLFNLFFAVFLLRRYKISGCVYTWCTPHSKGFQTKLFLAARRLNIPNICLPHGQNIFLNFDVNDYLSTLYAKTGRWPDFSPRNKFDLYVVQSKHHRDWNISWGMDPKIIVAWGSMRFSPSWIKHHLNFFDTYSKLMPLQDDAVKVVFFIPHWHYNVNVTATIDLIKEIAHMDNVLLAIKGHTRGDVVSASDYAYLAKLKHVDPDVKAPSSSLIAWADLVINFGSSIGLEAIASKKHVINPSFLHKNKTVFDHSGAVYDALSIFEVISLIDRARSGDLVPSKLTATNGLLKREVFADQENYDPITFYADSLLYFCQN